MHLNGDIGEMSLNWGKLAGNKKMDRIFMFVKII